MTKEQIRMLLNSGYPVIFKHRSNHSKPIPYIKIDGIFYYGGDDWAHNRYAWNASTKSEEHLIEWFYNEFDVIDYFEECLDSRYEWPSYL